MFKTTNPKAETWPSFFFTASGVQMLAPYAARLPIRSAVVSPKATEIEAEHKTNPKKFAALRGHDWIWGGWTENGCQVKPQKSSHANFTLAQ